MGAVYFYHLTRHSLEVALAQLLDRSLQAGWRVQVRGTRRDRLDWLDQKLWLDPEDGFLPHGLDGGPHDAMQPVLLTTSTTLKHAPHCLMCIDSAIVTAEEVAAIERTCIFFDGNDEEAVQDARGQWKSLTDAGCSAQYWSEESGRWEKKAEK